MQLTILGCGDAFGAGGNLQTSFLGRASAPTFLIDCGVTSLIGMRRLGFEPNDIDTVFVTHLHGDHFGGLAWFLVDAIYASARKRPLVVTGPKSIAERFAVAAETLYPGITATKRNFDFVFLEYEERTPIAVGPVTVVPFEVHHPSGAPPYALRFSLDGKVLVFTGDTGWVESLCEAAHGADLLISECFQYDVTLPIHLDYKTIDANFARLGAKRVLLTQNWEANLAATDKSHPSLYNHPRDGLGLDL